MRLRAEYRVGPDLRFLSNLDLMHMMERAFRRAQIPYALSEGFNPHIRLSMGTVLPVGLWGEHEYFDLALKCDMDVNDFIQRLNAALPPEVNVIRAVSISSADPSLMAVINSASYALVLNTTEFDLDTFFDELLSCPSLVVKSRGKKKNLDKELRSGIYRIDIEPQEQGKLVNIWVALGEPLNVRYDELLDLLDARGLERKMLRDIYRSGNYIYKYGSFLSPLEKVD